MFIRKIVGFALLVLGLVSLLGFISALNFSKTGLEGFIGAGPFLKHVGRGNEKWEKFRKMNASFTPSQCNLNNFNPPQLPIYFVEGLNHYTNHMRLYTSTTYINGVWIEDRVRYGDRQTIILSPHMTRYKVTPIIPFKKHIPVSKDTCYVSISAKYNSSTGTYLVKNCNEPYFAVSTAHPFNASEAVGGSIAKIEMRTGELSAIRDLALKITKGAKNDYEKVKRIEEYLKKNYKYDPNYPTATGVDPVYYFLFKSKRGICVHFASAFVIMCNSIGIPARLVVGYLAKPVPWNQTVFASQAHAWAEVRFKGGWMEFDPTPTMYRIPTVTTLKNFTMAVRVGETFEVSGTVRTKDGKPVSGYVEIYMKKNKRSQNGILLKLLKFEDGKFEAKIRAPNVTGKYYIVAHYVGSLRYEPSWSDPVVRIYGVPHFELRIPSKVATNFTVRGRLINYNGTGIGNAEIIVKVDGKIVDRVITDKEGNFIIFLRLSRGNHMLELYYPGSEFIAPIDFKKEVEAGDIDVLIANGNLWAGKKNDVKAVIFFNGRPIRRPIRIIWMGKIITVEPDRNGVVKFEIEPRDVGRIPIEFEVYGYSKVVILKSMAHVHISPSYEDETLKVKVVDDLGDPVWGSLIVNGRRVPLRNGLAEVRARGRKFDIYYPGDEFHPPAEYIYEIPPPYWLITLPIIAGVGYFVYRWYDGKRIELIVEREMKGLPLIWKVGEEIRFRVLCKGNYRVLVDGEIYEGNVVRFDEEGVHRIRAERFEGGKVRGYKEVEVKVVNDYGKAIAEVFKNLVGNVERLEGKDLKGATPREVMGIVPCRADLLLRLFELYKYGNRRGFTREDFLMAFEDYMKLRRCYGA